MKNIRVEKCGVIFLQLSVYTVSLPLFALSPYANSAPLRSGNRERRFGSTLSGGGGISSLKKVWPLVLRGRKAQRRRNIFSQQTQQFHFCFSESGIMALVVFLQSSLPRILSCCPSQIKPHLLLCYWPKTPVLHHIDKEFPGIAHRHAQRLA